MTRKNFVENIGDLVEVLEEEINSSGRDPGKLLYLTAMGVQHCLVGIATILDEECSAKSPDKSQSKDVQLELFDNE